MQYTHLGLHSKYEIGAGSRNFEDIIEKAKFLDVTSLGICDENTLAGTFAFQNACKKAKIDFCLGEQVVVKRKDIFYRIKLYVKNKRGWQNLLRVNKAVKIDNDGFIKEKDLFELGKGIIAVLCTDEIKHFNKAHYYKVSKYFDEFYYQFDPVEYYSNEKDTEHLESIQQYFKELYPACPPVLIQDSYYLDQEDAIIKRRLANIANKEGGYYSEDQHFKSLDELFLATSRLFKEDDDKLYDLMEEMLLNAEKIAKACKYEIETGKLHLPIYKMTEDERETFDNNEDLFNSLIEIGLNRIGKDEDKTYLNRIEEEKEVIKKGKFIDYFLILVDVYRYADKEGIMRNIGRGSVGGSLIAYCLGLIKIDPIKYNLLFTRFLNEARIMKEVKKEMIIVDSEQGEIELEPNKEVKILRNGDKMTILAKELKENDELL